MSKFSGVLTLTGLDDFITPSQQCIKPVVAMENRNNSKVILTVTNYSTKLKIITQALKDFDPIGRRNWYLLGSSCRWFTTSSTTGKNFIE
jgi:hypothetical protein